MHRSQGLLAALLVPLAALGTALAEDQPQAPTATPSQSVATEAQPAPTPSAPATVAEAVKPDLGAPLAASPTPPAAPVVAEAAKPEAPAQAATPLPVPAAEPTKAVELPAAKFALAAELADRLSRDKSAGLVREDRDAAQKFYEGRQGAPLWVTASGFTPAAQALQTEISKAGDFGLDAAAFKLPGALASGASTAELADAEATLTLAALKYARHARGGRMDPSALSLSIDRKAQLLPPAKVLEQLASADKPDVALKSYQPQNPQFEKLRQKWLAVRAGRDVLDAPAAATAAAADATKGKGKKPAVEIAEKPPTPAALERKLLVNMEMWRWMPTLGSYYIQPNIPEFTVRVMKDGHAIHTERIVTGQPTKKTPIFSDEMKIVVFKPFWNVPESIKYKEMMPQLMRGASLERSGYKAEINGRIVQPGTVDWREVDMRSVHIFQPPGEGNALGRVKFLFPNRHDVYLHDTPSKSLFNETSRAFSHGCIRVRDPLKLAEVILSHDKNWTREQVDRQATNGPENTEIKLERPIPIHITYFTAWVDDGDKLHTAKDVYGHEARVQLGIEGKANLIEREQRDELFAGPSRDERLRYAEEKRKKTDPLGNWLKNIFN